MNGVDSAGKRLLVSGWVKVQFRVGQSRTLGQLQ